MGAGFTEETEVLACLCPGHEWAGVRGCPKNLVLSGLKELKMVDSKLVSEDDATSQFLAPRDKMGENRAEASLQRLQQLNPMVSVGEITKLSLILKIFRLKLQLTLPMLRIKMPSSSRSSA